MQEIKNQIATLVLHGEEYAVLAIENTMINGRANDVSRKFNMPSFLVSRVFTNEVDHEGVQILEKTYAPYHWITISGPFVIHWTPAPFPIVIESDEPIATENVDWPE